MRNPITEIIVKARTHHFRKRSSSIHIGFLRGTLGSDGQSPRLDLFTCIVIKIKKLDYKYNKLTYNRHYDNSNILFAHIMKNKKARLMR